MSSNTDELEPKIQAILDMSDEDILAELRAEGRDPDEVAAEMHALFENAVAIANALQGRSYFNAIDKQRDFSDRFKGGR